MDPVFGLSAMRETKAMDAARTRNKSFDKKLRQTFHTLDLELKTKYSKVHDSVGDLNEMLATIDPFSPKTIIYPEGLTETEKQKYRKVRRGSIPSMSLEEFDLKMESKRRQKRAHRPKVYRPEVEQDKNNIVEVDVQGFCASIQKHRQTMRDAYDRATSNDVRFSEGKQDGGSKTGSREGSRRGSTASGSSLPFPPGFVPGRRRNTVSGPNTSNNKKNSSKKDTLSLDPDVVERLKKKMEESSLSDFDD